MRAHARQEQEAELALPSHIKSLKQQIHEVSAMVASKQEELYHHTLNEQAHDRIYETLQRDIARLELLKRALKDSGHT